YARRLTGKTWGPETRVSTSDSNDWEPAVALDRRGVAWISWDSYHTGNYDVFLRSFDAGKLGPQIAITTEPAAQFHTSVAVDGDGAIALVFRHWTLANSPNEIYHFYVTHLSGDTWSVPYKFAQSSGQNTQRPSLALAPDGKLTAAYSSDGRSQTVVPTDQMHA